MPLGLQMVSEVVTGSGTTMFGCFCFFLVCFYFFVCLFFVVVFFFGGGGGGEGGHCEKFEPLR